MVAMPTLGWRLPFRFRGWLALADPERTVKQSEVHRQVLEWSGLPEHLFADTDSSIPTSPFV